MIDYILEIIFIRNSVKMVEFHYFGILTVQTVWYESIPIVDF